VLQNELYSVEFGTEAVSEKRKVLSLIDFAFGTHNRTILEKKMA